MTCLVGYLLVAAVFLGVKGGSLWFSMNFPHG